MAPITASDLIFSEQANHHFSKTLGDLKRSTLSIHNRLQSIQTDALFAERVAAAYGRPLIANERCGSWYIDPQAKGGSAYFKSTDGHTGVWKFSTRRLNLHLLEIIEINDGCIIVDSTRRGKRMPDALSKTIPIWCNVINRVLFPNDTHHSLFTPPQVVSESEHAQIAALLPSFHTSLQDLDISFNEFKKLITKPLRPIWITPDSNVTPTTTIFDDFHPVICCTVSRRVTGGEVSEGGYIQGAGDDTENWAHGLTPLIFWRHRDLLLSTSETELPETIGELVSTDGTIITNRNAIRCVAPTKCLFIAPISAIDRKEFGPNRCTVFLESIVSEVGTQNPEGALLQLGLGQHKTASRNLRMTLPKIIKFAEDFLFGKAAATMPAERSIVIACENGKDISVGAALAMLCLLFDDAGQLREPDDVKDIKIDKTIIRKKLSWISTSMPETNPSRATLQSVNSFLMERPK